MAVFCYIFVFIFLYLYFILVTPAVGRVLHKDDCYPPQLLSIRQNATCDIFVFKGIFAGQCPHPFPFISRLAFKGHDVNFSKLKDPVGPMSTLENKQFKMFNPSGFDYSTASAQHIEANKYRN